MNRVCCLRAASERPETEEQEFRQCFISRFKGEAGRTRGCGGGSGNLFFSELPDNESDDESAARASGEARILNAFLVPLRRLLRVLIDSA